MSSIIRFKSASASVSFSSLQKGNVDFSSAGRSVTVLTKKCSGAILQETGFNLLQENGGRLLKEQQ